MIERHGTEPSGLWLRFGVPAGLVLLGGAALAVDVPVARWFHQEGFPGEIRKFLDRMELFGAAQGLVILFITIGVLDPRGRRLLPRAVTASLGSGILALALKMLVVRQRPRSEALLDVQRGFDGTALDTFGEWLPFLSAGSDGMSFPSAHSATAIGLALALGWMYPRGRMLFLVFGALACAQRLEARAHFLSDVCWGAAVGWVFARVILGPGRVGRWFERWERTPGE